MSAAVRFKQVNLSVKVKLVFHGEYFEYKSSEDPEGFNISYADLPLPFEYGTRRQLDTLTVSCYGFPFVIPLILAIFSGPGEGRAILLGVGVMLFGWCLQKFLVKEYTVIKDLLIVKDAQHDRILAEIETRRLAALRKAAVLDPYAPPREELDRLRWLKEQGALDESELMAHTARLIPLIHGDAPVKEAGEKVLN